MGEKRKQVRNFLRTMARGHYREETVRSEMTDPAPLSTIPSLAS
jgi:hypothetical protein